MMQNQSNLDKALCAAGLQLTMYSGLLEQILVGCGTMDHMPWQVAPEPRTAH
jgi:hypothetical protein